MTMHKLRLTSFALAGLAATVLTACDLDVPDLNNPGLDELLQNNPTPDAINAACTGLLIGNRRNHAAAFGYVDILGILGREAYNFDTADPRFVGELLGGNLNQGSPFGGGFWAGPYANIRLANVTLAAVDKINVELLPEENKQGIRGFVHTIIALDLLEVIATHDTNGAVIDTNRAVADGLGAIVDKDATYTEIKRLLDLGASELTAGGDEFTFQLSSGYAGFDTPPTFREFNRAIKARVAAYTATNATQYAEVLSALDESFIDDMAPFDFDLGVYYTYSTGTGDLTNGLINPNIFVHPSIAADAQMNGTMVDARFTSKVAKVDDPDNAGSSPGSTAGVTLMSDLVFTLYPGPDAPVSVIRNEELILLKAEALFFTGMAVAANTELNLVRTGSGNLLPVPVTTDPAVFTTQLLYERQYSLLFEGHRWIDMRRFNRVADLPLDDPAFKRNVRFPIPLNECNARPDEPRCALGSN
jgi:starch-binding outer membrane protein, SusD/RagB family